MTMTPTQLIDARLVADLASTLTRLRHARADCDPNHNSLYCEGCYACALERQLNRLADRLPRKANA
jgi:hypothetical protein